MRITPDTNVLVSAFISRAGQPAAVIEIAVTFPEVELVLSEPILEEFMNVLSRPEVKHRFNYSETDIANFAQVVRNSSRMVRMVSNFKVIPSDPDDNVIVNTAYDGRADYIVSGDRHLQSLKRFRSIQILGPKAMLLVFRRRFGEILTRQF